MCARSCYNPTLRVSTDLFWTSVTAALFYNQNVYPYVLPSTVTTRKWLTADCSAASTSTKTGYICGITTTFAPFTTTGDNTAITWASVRCCAL